MLARDLETGGIDMIKRIQLDMLSQKDLLGRGTLAQRLSRQQWVGCMKKLVDEALIH